LTTERRLAAIMFTDIVGYTALMAKNEASGLRARERHRSILGGVSARYHGQVVDENGDELVLSFSSAVDAVNCALAVQAELRDDSKLELRVGIHLGDVVFEEGRVYGDGVNVASCVRPLAEPGGICVSEQVHDLVKNQANIEARSLGAQAFKNVAPPVEVFSLRGTPAPAPAAQTAPGPRTLRLTLVSVGAVLAVAALALWATWPRPAGFALAMAGLLSLPEISTPTDRPSIVVLPFTNMSPDPQHEYLADGFTEDITTDLAALQQLFVISRNSAYTYKDRSVNLARVGRELGVRYALEGSVRVAGDRARVTAQLIEVANDRHLWADRYDVELADLFASQAEISEQILAALRIEIDEAERAAIRRKPTEDLSAYELVRRATTLANPVTREGLLEGQRLCERAVELAPDFAEAHACVAGFYSVAYGYLFDLDGSKLGLAENHARRALELDPLSAFAHAMLAGIHMVRQEREENLVAAQCAVELAPSDALAHRMLSMAQAWSGPYVAALRSMQRVHRLDPRFPSHSMMVMGAANLGTGRVEEAIALLEGALEHNPNESGALIWLTVAYDRSGRDELARQAVDRLREILPGITVELLQDHFLRALPDVDDVVESLLNAGLPPGGPTSLREQTRPPRLRD
jgi:adenylate cyclase